MNRAFFFGVALTSLFVASTARAEAPAPSHQLTASARLGAMAYLSRFQTAGGIGGGLGVRDTIDGRYLLELDAMHLVEIGSAFGFRIAAGLQRSERDEHGSARFWIPSVMVTGTMFAGDRLRFLTADHPTPVVAPATAIGLAVAPLRFVAGGTEISLLELGAGLGWDFPGLGTSISVSLIEVGARF